MKYINKFEDYIVYERSDDQVVEIVDIMNYIRISDYLFEYEYVKISELNNKELKKIDKGAYIDKKNMKIIKKK